MEALRASKNLLFIIQRFLSNKNKRRPLHTPEGILLPAVFYVTLTTLLSLLSCRVQSYVRAKIAQDSAKQKGATLTMKTLALNCAAQCKTLSSQSCVREWSGFRAAPKRQQIVSLHNSEESEKKNTWIAPFLCIISTFCACFIFCFICNALAEWDTDAGKNCQ